MTVKEWLDEATAALARAGIATARLDVLVLLEDTLKHDRAWLLAHPEQEFDQSKLTKLNKQIEQRAQHEPLAYIRGKTEFYGREFILSKHVLEPRPESETMIELFKQLDLPEQALVADIGSGSGAIGITAALEKPDIQVVCIDIDANTLVVAKQNAHTYKVRAQFYQGDLLDAQPDDYDVLLCNLPYVPDHYTINPAAMREPKIAIFGGKDGLDLYRRLFSQLHKLARKPTYVLTESLPFQHEELTAIARDTNYRQVQKDDFIQVFRHALL